MSTNSKLPPLHLSKLPPPHPKPPPSPHLPHNQETKKPTVRFQLSQLCKQSRISLARRLFDSLPHPAPTILWNTLLIGYVCNSMHEDALQFYSRMNNAGIISDSYTYSSALKACAETRQLLLGKSMHCHIVRRSSALPKNRIIGNSLLNMYASCLEVAPPRVDVVRVLFDRMSKKTVVTYNTMIAWCVKIECFDDALSQFKKMVEAGVGLTVVSFINVFPAASNAKGKRWCDLLYGMVVKCGSEYVNDLFVVSSAIFMYAETEDMRSARLIFDSAKTRNIEVWNTMIGGYVRNDQCEEGIRLFIRILENENGVAADSVTFLTSLIAVSQMQDVGLGQQIQANLVKRSSKPLPLILCNSLVVMYSRCGYVQCAFDVFNQMHERDTVTWNTMISAFVQRKLNLEGLLLVFEMQKQGFVVDSVTISALLSAASNLGSLRIGKETHGYLIRHDIHCEGMESYLIDMYSKSGRVETAKQLFDGERSDERDQVTWNAMIAGYVQNGETEEALLLFRKMIVQGSNIPNSVTLASILPACSPLGGGIQAGKQIHGFSIRRFIDKNVFVGTALVDMYSRCGEIISAERVFDGLKEKNSVTYTTMLSGFGQHGLGERALSLFQLMQESGIRPDAITFVAILSACSYSGLVNEGLALFESMKNYAIEATPEHYCCIVDLLGRAGRVEEAYEFVCSLGDDGNTVGIWGSLLAACRIHQKFELGELVSERLFEMEKGNDVAGYHVLLSNVYAAEGKWKNVDRVRKDMIKGGLRKEPGSSWIDVDDASHRFMSRDQKHPEREEIYTMLKSWVQR